MPIMTLLDVYKRQAMAFATSSSIKASAPKASVPATPLAPVEKAVEVETYTVVQEALDTN